MDVGSHSRTMDSRPAVRGARLPKVCSRFAAAGRSQPMDKMQLVAQLVCQLEASARAALAARDGVAAEAREGATPDEKREDARAAHQLAGLGRAQQRRAQQALAEVDSL